MERHECLCRTFDLITKTIYVVRLVDFKSCRQEKLPSFWGFSNDCLFTPRKTVWLTQAVTLKKGYTNHFLFSYPVTRQLAISKNPDYTWHLKTRFFIKNGLILSNFNIKHFSKDKRGLTSNALLTWMCSLSSKYFGPSLWIVLVFRCCATHVAVFVGTFKSRTLSTAHSAHTPHLLYTKLSTFYLLTQLLAP